MATTKPSRKPKSNGKSEVINGKAICIDRNGNLRLLVGPDAVQMQVDANALRRASKVFDRMLLGPFLESHKKSNWTVELPEDDPEALRVIFHAVHGNFRNMPEDLAPSKLYAIAMMADKFAMLDSLEPWNMCWTYEMDPDPWKPEDKEKTTHDDLQRLVVLYHLGSCRQFSDALSVLALKSKINDDGQLLFKMATSVDGVGSGPQSSEWDRVGLLPKQIIDFAQNERRKLISHLLSSLNDVFAYCTSKVENLNNECSCRSTALGLMIRHLVQEGLWPLPNTNDVHLSVAELSRITGKIREGITRPTFKTCGTSGKIRASHCQNELPLVCESEAAKKISNDAEVKFLEYFVARELRVPDN